MVTEIAVVIAVVIAEQLVVLLAVECFDLQTYYNLNEKQTKKKIALKLSRVKMNKKITKWK